MSQTTAELAQQILDTEDSDAIQLMWVNNGHPEWDDPDPMPALKEMAKHYLRLYSLAEMEKPEYEVLPKK